MLVLGIETSCDETAVAIVDDQKNIHCNLVLSQLSEHEPYGGVVPEVAARAHLDHLPDMVEQAMRDTGLSFNDLDGIAVTAGPGLIGGVFVGVMTAKAIALAHDLPFLAVNHLEGHALSVRLTDTADFPYLLLLVSGGHCAFLVAEDVGCYRQLGATLDDAIGEAFDKSARLLGLGYPGGPFIEKMAAQGRADRFAFPRPLVGRAGCDFSFSGLKTAVRREIERLKDEMNEQTTADICASFQKTVSDILIDRCQNALTIFQQDYPQGRHLVMAGGVAANQALRTGLETLANRFHLDFVAPPIELCTDNAAMIAWAGLEKLRRGQTDSLDFKARPRWNLEEMNT